MTTSLQHYRVKLDRYLERREQLTMQQLAELPPLDICDRPTAEMPALPKSAQLPSELAAQASPSMPAMMPTVIPDLPPEHVREWARAQLDDYARRYGGYKQAAPVTKPQLPLDAEGRPYLRLINPYEDTQLLVEAAVEHFIAIEHNRPAVVFLSALRYFSYGMREQYWMPQERGMDAIPFGFAYGQKDINYDVLVIGEAPSDGN